MESYKSLHKESYVVVMGDSFVICCELFSVTKIGQEDLILEFLSSLSPFSFSPAHDSLLTF